MSRIQLRRDTTTRWGFINPVLASGEMGIDLTLAKFKMGNGTQSWAELQWGTVFWADVGQPNGVAPLDADGNVPNQYINFPDIPPNTHYFAETVVGNFPSPGQSNMLYLETTTRLLWRWNGTEYVLVSPPPDATGIKKGIVQLTGDLGGTAALPLVKKLSGIELVGSAPEPGQVIKAITSSTAGWANDNAGSGGGGGGGDDERFKTFEQDIGDGTMDPITVTHMMGTRQILASMTRKKGDGEIISLFRIKAPTINAVVIEPDMVLEPGSWRLTLVGSMGLSDVTPPTAPNALTVVTERSDAVKLKSTHADATAIGRNWYGKPTDEVGELHYVATTQGDEYEFVELTGATEYDFAATALDAAGNESALSDILTHETPAGAYVTHTPASMPFSTTFFAQNWGNGVQLLGSSGAIGIYGRGSADYGYAKYYGGIMCKTLAQTDDWMVEGKLLHANPDDRGNHLVIGGNSATAFTTGVLLMIRGGDAFFQRPGPGFYYAPNGGSPDGTIRGFTAVTNVSNDIWRARVTKEGSDYRYRAYQNGVLRIDFLDVGAAVYGVPGKAGGWGQAMICSTWQQFFSTNHWVGPLSLGDIVALP